MKPKSTNAHFRQLPGFSLAIFFLILSSSLLLSCKSGNKSDEDSEELTGGGGKKKFELHGLRYDSAQISKWLDSTNYKKCVFQFYTENLKKPTDDLSLVSYILKSDDTWANAASPDMLKIVKDSVYKFEGITMLGNIEKSIRIFAKNLKNPDGTIKPFTYVYLKPKLDASNHLTYIIHSIVKAGKVEILELGDDELNPVPPGRPGQTVQ